MGISVTPSNVGYVFEDTQAGMTTGRKHLGDDVVDKHYAAGSANTGGRRGVAGGERTGTRWTSTAFAPRLRRTPPAQRAAADTEPGPTCGSGMSRS